MKYLIVLFKNNKRKKILNKFKTYDRAKKFFDNLIEQNKSIRFDCNFENGSPSKYEIGFLESGSTNFDLYFVKDEIGRQIKIDIDDPNYRIIKISNYKIEEFIFDVRLKKKISFNLFLKLYLIKNGIKLISKINNKIIIQNDEKIVLFSLKTDQECDRFIDMLEEYLISENRIDCILVKDSTKQQKKYLYDLLEKTGFNKSFIYRKFTTYIKK